MDPIRYTGEPSKFENRRNELNEILAFCGYSLAENGKLSYPSPAQTSEDAEERAGRLQVELRRRGVHTDVLKCCRAELIVDNYFDAVFEATKSVAGRVRSMSGLSGDGVELVDQALSPGNEGTPLMAFNSLTSEADQKEQADISNLMKGPLSAFRNGSADDPKITWAITEQDALDLLTIVSFFHRRMDDVRTPTAKLKAVMVTSHA